MMAKSKAGTANAVESKKSSANFTPEEIRLRQWCVEQAIENARSTGQWTGLGTIPTVGHHVGDPTKVAQAIYDWVTR
jgi:hypothetical protein